MMSYTHLFFFLLFRPPPRSTLFPYTTLFRFFRRTREILEVLHKNANHGIGKNQGNVLGLRAKPVAGLGQDRKSTRLNSSHTVISYAVFCLKKKKSILQRKRIADRYCHHQERKR